MIHMCTYDAYVYHFFAEYLITHALGLSSKIKFRILGGFVWLNCYWIGIKLNEIDGIYSGQSFANCLCTPTDARDPFY